jgi:hypothetical protein
MNQKETLCGYCGEFHEPENNEGNQYFEPSCTED